jgi:hypothetical protein
MTAPKTQKTLRADPSLPTFVQDDSKKAPFPVILSVS